MKQILLQGGHLVTPTEERLTDLIVGDGHLKLPKNQKDLDGNEFEKVDLSGCYVTPGLIDLQVNGGGTCNLWADPTQNEFEKFCSELVQNGVTCFYPTLITDKVDHLKKNIQFLESLGVGKTILRGNGGAKIHTPGIHLEGPFISPLKPGVHPKEEILPISIAGLEGLLTPSVKIMTLAPEQKDAQGAINFLKEKGVVVSLGHSNATFAEAQNAFENGVSMITHTFNALPALHHRAPGAVAAALLDGNIWCCLICDGLHVDPNMVKLALRLKGVDRLILVTDIASVGTAGGGLVGSSIYLCEAVRNLVQWKVASFREAIQMATINPAKALGISDRFAMIGDGYPADLVVWDKSTLKIKMVFLGGDKVYEA
jgi:N-acetylglucosamine-6-phosphate deacetylase